MKLLIAIILSAVFLRGPFAGAAVDKRNGFSISTASTINGKTPNSAINAQTIVAPADVTTNMVSYWKLDTSGGADAFGSNTLTETSVSYVTGVISNAASLTRASSSRLARANAVALGGSFTVCFWYKPTSQPASLTTHTLVSKWNGTGDQRAYRFAYRDNGTQKTIEYYINVDGGIFGTAGTETPQTLSNATWYHLAFRFDLPTTRFLVAVNGASINGATGINFTVGPAFSSTAAFMIGGLSEGTPSDFADGVFDEAVVYTRALTLGDIQYLYNSGAGQRPPGI